MRFLVEIKFDLQEMSKIAPLIPGEQAHIKELVQQKLVEELFISADRSKVWIIMPGDSDVQIQERLKDFPLYPYMQKEIILLYQ